MMLPQLRPIAPQLSVGRRAALNFLTAHGGLIICLLFLLVGLDTAGDYGLLYDEQPQIVIATANLNYIRGQAESLEQSCLTRSFFTAWPLSCPCCWRSRPWAGMP